MRRPTPSPKPRAKPTPSTIERSWAGLYGSLMVRYKDCDPEWGVAMQAVKLFAKRVGLDRLLEMLVRYGTPVVAERCRNELTDRQVFLAHMMATYPPDDEVEAEGAIQEMAEDLAIIDSPAGAMRMLRYLDRLRNRELMMRATKEVVH